MKIERYKLDEFDSISESPDGELVFYEDIKHLIEAEGQYEKVAKDLSALVQNVYRWYMTCPPDGFYKKMTDVIPHLQRLSLPSGPLRSKSDKEQK